MMYLRFLFIGLLVFSFTACGEKDTSGLKKVHWDRDMCARCVMVVSDRQNAIQVRNPQTGQKYMFDDIGCMV